jgi:hypothetical protein
MTGLTVVLILLNGVWAVLEYFWHYRFTLFALIALYQLEVIVMHARLIPQNLPRAIGDLEDFLADQRRQAHRALDARCGFLPEDSD